MKHAFIFLLFINTSNAQSQDLPPIFMRDDMVFTVEADEDTVDPYRKTSLAAIKHGLTVLVQLNESDGTLTAEMMAKEDIHIPINCDLLYQRGPSLFHYTLRYGIGADDKRQKHLKVNDIPAEYIEQAGAIHLEKGMSVRRKDYFWTFRPGLWESMMEDYKKLPKVDPRKVTVTLSYLPQIYVFRKNKASIVNSWLRLCSDEKGTGGKWLTLTFSGNTLLKLMRLEKEWEKKGRPRWTDSLPKVRVEPSTYGISQATEYLFSEFDNHPPRKERTPQEEFLFLLNHGRIDPPKEPEKVKDNANESIAETE